MTAGRFLYLATPILIAVVFWAVVLAAYSGLADKTVAAVRRYRAHRQDGAR